MTNEGVLDIVRRCNLKYGVELVPGRAYLFNRKFRNCDTGRMRYFNEEIIVLVNNGVKVGGIYRMGSYDIHCVMNEMYRDKHIMSDFFKTGIIQELWPENESVELCDVRTREEYDKKKHLVDILGLSIKNEEEIERHLSYIDEQRDKYIEMGWM